MDDLYDHNFCEVSRVARKPFSVFPTRSDTHGTVLPKKMARLEISDLESEGIVLCSKVEGADQIYGNFTFVYAKAKNSFFS